MTISLYEDATSATGTFVNYDTYSPGQRAQLPNQRHVDLRSFEQDAIFGSSTMLWLDGDSMSFVGGATMGDLENSQLIQSGENWTLAPETMSVLDTEHMSDLDGESMATLDTTGGGTAVGTVSPQSDRHNFKGIRITCPTGVTSTRSVMPPIDMSPITTGYISVALPALPAGSLTMSATFLDLTSNIYGDFAAGPTVSLAFSTSSTTLSATDCEARFPISALATLNLGNITGVQFRITSTASCTFRCLAIRAIASTWEFAPIDQNTLYQRIGACVPPTGTATPTYTFPTASAPVTPTDWPILLFASDRAGNPAMVDLDIGVVIQTGVNAGIDKFVYYLRELPFIPNTVGALESDTMGQLDETSPDGTMGHLDDFANTKFITVSLQWGSTGQIKIGDQAGTNYTLSDFTLASASRFYVRTTLSDHSVRVIVYPLSQAGVITGSSVYDSTAVIDNVTIPRWAGRVGWYAHLQDGDTFVEMIRPRRAVFSEYRSLPLRSETPVTGARLYSGSSPDVDLTGSIEAVNGATVYSDISRSRSGRGRRIVCPGIAPGEGILTTPMRLENVVDTEIEFDLFAQTSMQLTAVLEGEHALFLLPIQPFPAAHWTHITLSLEPFALAVLPGPYNLYVVQNFTSSGTFYLDNLYVHTKAVSWQGRGQAADPWRMRDPAWIKFGDMINSAHDGALLGQGNALQIRGQALTQTAQIGALQVLPQYATLGNFGWRNAAETINTEPPTPTYVEVDFSWSPAGTFTTSGMVVVPNAAHNTLLTFTITTSIDNQGDDLQGPLGIVSYDLEYGDGTSSVITPGSPITTPTSTQTTTHTYKLPNLQTYAVLRVTDTLGRIWTARHQMYLS